MGSFLVADLDRVGEVLIIHTLKLHFSTLIVDPEVKQRV